MRRSSSRRHVLAFLITVVFAALVTSIPALIETIYEPRYSSIQLSESHQVSLLPVNESETLRKYLEQNKALAPQEASSPVPGDASSSNNPDRKTTAPEKKEKESKKIIDLEVEIPLEASDMLEEEYIDPEKTYWIVEEMPVFPGGEGALLRFLTANLNYPPQATQQKQQAQVLCRFIINKDGKVSDIEIIESGGEFLDEEVVRVLKLMPQWEAGRRKGKPVKVRFSLPIQFGL